MAKQAGRKATFMYGEDGSEVAVADIADTAMTVGNTPIPFDAQGNDGFVTVLADVQDGKQVSIATNFTFDSEASLTAIQAAAYNGAHIAGKWEIIDSGTSNNASIQCDTWSVSGLSITGGTTGAVTGSMTIATSGSYTYTAAADS